MRFYATAAICALVPSTVIAKKPPPKTQSELDIVLRLLEANRRENLFRKRMVPDKALWTDTTHEKLRARIFPDSRFWQTERTVVLGSPPIYQSGDTGVFNLPHEAGDAWVIKYHRYCPDPSIDPIDPTVVEAFFLKDLESIPGLTHKLIYFSAPIDEPQQVGKLAAVGGHCDDAGTRPKVRFMITEKVGISVSKFAENMGGTVSVRVAVKIGIQMIKLLEKLHTQKGYIHGDGHYGNYAVHPTTGNLILIDFGRSRLVNPGVDFAQGEDTPQPGIVPTPPGSRDSVWCHTYLSQWESRYRKPSFRDDVYRAFINVAILMYGDRLFDGINQMCRGIDAYYKRRFQSGMRASQFKWEDCYLDYKERVNMFDGLMAKFAASPDVPVGIPFRLSTLVRDTALERHEAVEIGHFEDALKILRDTRIKDKPRYRAIVSFFSKIVQLADSTPHTVSTTVDFSRRNR
jgi:serine/threonine protein kinase